MVHQEQAPVFVVAYVGNRLFLFREWGNTPLHPGAHQRTCNTAVWIVPGTIPPTIGEDLDARAAINEALKTR